LASGGKITGPKAEGYPAWLMGHFASDGLVMLHELAAGVPRVLDAVAEGAMKDAAAREERLIGRATVRRAWQATPYG
jgi:hypothetical protein